MARFLRFTLYFINKGRTFTDGADDESRAQRLFENYSALAVGATITVAIVIVVPNGISDYVHILILLLVLMMILVYQAYKYRNAAPADDVAKSAPAAETAVSEDVSANKEDDGKEDAPSDDTL